MAFPYLLISVYTIRRNNLHLEFFQNLKILEEQKLVETFLEKIKNLLNEEIS